MAKGRIKKWYAEKGFGFILPTGGGPDVFVHVNSIMGDRTAAHEGLEVEYEVGPGKKGPEAKDVRLTGIPEAQTGRENLARESHGQRADTGATDKNYPFRLSEGTKEALRNTQQLHPLLVLDKFACYPKPDLVFDQEQQRDHLKRVIACRGDDSVLEIAHNRRNLLTGAATALAFAATTTGPFTLHLSRVGAIENAGLCMHPIYGFVYLPGSGLKGVAHAFACEIWLPQQSEKQTAWQTICRVFGAADSPWLKDLARRANHLCDLKGEQPLRTPKDAAAGSVVFHDALPQKWPRLMLDIVNNHHPKYYGDSGEAHPPGDWENPNPVTFLAVERDSQFNFLLQKRRAGTAQADLDIAAQWLMGALENFGAGAKTAAGYGRFKVSALASPAANTTQLPEAARNIWKGAIGQGQTRSRGPIRAQFETMLELGTPAFLAGSGQAREDCDLRPATLRGLLRWWWRTLHSGFLSTSRLREIEAALWGDTSKGGAINIALERQKLGDPQEFKFKEVSSGKLKAQPTQAFKDRQQISATAQPIAGMYYMSFGMDDNKKVNGREIRFSRHFIAPPASWDLRISARSSEGLSAEQVLDEALAALWLLVRFGGVGAKSRKGFGSLLPTATAKLPWKSVGDVCDAAAQFRKALRCDTPALSSAPASPALSHALPPIEFKVGGGTYWAAIEKLGGRYKQIISSFERKSDRAALGLPRNKGERSNRQGVERHAAPLLFHLEPQQNGEHLARAIAFPGPHPRDLSTSTLVLKEALKQLSDAFPAMEAARATISIVMPPTERPKEDEAVGSVIEKPAKRKAVVQIDGGAKADVTKEVASLQVGQRVKIRRLPTGEWQYIGPA